MRSGPPGERRESVFRVKDVIGLHFLRLTPAALLLLVACSLSTPTVGGASPRPSVSAGAGEIPVATPSPGSNGTTNAAFDAVHVYSVLAPAVGLIIVNTRTGTAEVALLDAPGLGVLNLDGDQLLVDKRPGRQGGEEAGQRQRQGEQGAPHPKGYRAGLRRLADAAVKRHRDGQISRDMALSSAGHRAISRDVGDGGRAVKRFRGRAARVPPRWAESWAALPDRDPTRPASAA